jgi:hypothetical protein
LFAKPFIAACQEDTGVILERVLSARETWKEREGKGGKGEEATRREIWL